MILIVIIMYTICYDIIYVHSIYNVHKSSQDTMKRASHGQD